MLKQEQLKQLFAKRKDAYNKTSSSILEHLRSSVLAAVDEYFTELNEVGDKRELKWDQIGYVEQHNMLVLLGMIHYAPGAQVITETGDVVTITEELAPYFQLIIRIGLPFNMVDETKDAIKEFLKKREEVKEEEQTDAVQFLRNLLKVADEDMDDGSGEFDFDSLSEEQRKGLIVPKQGKPS